MKSCEFQGQKLKVAFPVALALKLLRSNAQEIERYLQSHPNAADTVEGIVKWWLQRQRYIETIDCVHTALDVLVKKGSVVKRTNADGKNVYRCSFSGEGSN